MALSPGILLAGLVIALFTQATRVIAGPRARYPATLGLSVAGLVGGEILAGSGHLAHPSLGVLHPVADLLVMAVLQGAAVLVLTPRVR